MSRMSDFNRVRGSQVGSRVTQKLDETPLDVTHIYKITTKGLKNLFDQENAVTTRQNLLQGHSGPKGILTKLQTEIDTGIMGDERDLYRRQSFFGVNEKPAPVMPSFFDSVKEALNEKILLLIAVFAVLSIIAGMIYHPTKGWIEGVSIIVALFILVLISSLNDIHKDKTFVRLQSFGLDEELPTVRGKKGSVQSVNIWDLVVGDIVHLTAGDKVPADCLIVDGQQLKVDESHCMLSGPAEVIKNDLSVENEQEKDPFLYADAYVLEGGCRAVVCCVGRASTRGVQGKALDTSKKTALEGKLFNLSKTFTYIGIIAAIAILAVSIVMMVLGAGFSDSDKKGAMIIKKLIENMTLALIVIIVAIPEGLPMTVTISLAGSVINMYKDDKILVRQLDGPEKMGQVTEILCGKTGTMTTEKMQVISCFAQNINIDMFRKNTIHHCVFDKDTVEMLKESILWNTEAHIEINENSFYQPVGNGTECSLISWLQDAEIDAQKFMLKKEGKVRAQIGFDTKRKRSIIAVQHPGMEDTVRVYIKGAPELVLENCASCFDERNQKKAFDGNTSKEYVLDNIMKQTMTSKGFRAIAFSFKDYALQDFQSLSDFQTEATINELEQNQTFIGLVSLKDPLRDNVKNVVKYAAKGRINVRMVSGDNLDTASVMALDAGILKQEEFGIQTEVEQQKFIMEAKQLRSECGPVRTEQGEDGETIFSLDDDKQQRFNQIFETLRVLGRCEPEDKLLVTVGLKGMKDSDFPEGRKVAVVGDGINDLWSFRAADVSFAMGSGKSISRNAATFVLCNDEFEAVLRSVMWGRNIFANVKKFLQFQVTCNFACVATLIVGTIGLTEPPFGPTQLIWLNLIMDILGAIALATSRPLASIINQEATSGKTKILTTTIWRQVYGVAVWMCAVMFLVVWLGRTIYGLDYEKDTQTTDRCPKDAITGERPDTCEEKTFAENKKIHLTIIFTTFVFLQFFNAINCRVIGADEYNIFKQLHKSIPFILVLLVIFGVQYATCEFGLFQFIFETAQITGEQFGQCVLTGATVLIAAFALKLSPAEWVEKIPVQIDENEVMGEGTRLMDGYSQSKGGIDQLRFAINQQDDENDGYTREN